MRITLVNQAFSPDVVSSGQHLTDLALELAARGHLVTVLTSRRAYDHPEKAFPKHEVWRGIRIYRLFTTRFGKSAKWRRAADFASFTTSCCWRLCTLPHQDLILAMTSPPLIAFFAAVFSYARGSKLCYWIMDLNPDEAVAAGWLRPSSFATRILEWCSRFSLHHASAVVVLDRFMRSRVLDKSIAADKVAIIPPWSHDSEVTFDPQGRARLRRANQLEHKFVVMYAGNHSPCHPLDTVLGAMDRLRADKDVVFCFVGGGSEFGRVKSFIAQRQLSNALCLPYQPIERLAETLSAADLHLVVMGNPFVGIVHPCKVYNIMRIASPLIYIGPKPSHVSDILHHSNGSIPSSWVEHGDVTGLVAHIAELKKAVPQGPKPPASSGHSQYSKAILLQELVKILEALGSNSALTVESSFARSRRSST